MRISTTLALLAAFTAGFAMLTPTIGALDIGCTETTEVTTLPAGTSTLFTPPGADVLGWTPECVIVDNGSTLTFTQRDAIGHGVLIPDCIVDGLGLMDLRNVPTTTLTLSYDAESSIVTAFGAGPSGEGEFACEGIGLLGEGTLTIDYICEFHGAGMPGKIVLEL